MNAHKPNYFKGLDTLRFLCCLMVIVNHTEFSKLLLLTSEETLETSLVAFVDPLSYRMLWAELAVTCFFTISGFLISHLLFAEKSTTSTISIKRFYIKRILRVWPVYYLVVLLSFFALPYIDLFKIPIFSEMLLNCPHFWEKFFYFLIVLPNIGFMDFFIPYLSHTWSIGVEEIFYYVWAPLIKWTTQYLKIFIGILIFFTMVSIGVGASPGTHDLPQLFKPLGFWSNVFYYLRISSMAIGGIYAYIYFYKKEKALQFLYRKDVQVFVYLSSAFLFAFNVYVPYIHHSFYSVLCGFLILNVGTNPQSVLRLDYEPMNYWGRLSYGLYVFHFIPITMLIKLGVVQFDCHFDTYLSNILLYICSILGAMFFAYLSHHIVEKRFMALRNKKFLY